MKVEFNGEMLNAEFSVNSKTPNSREFEIVFESRGGTTRNTDYGTCLALVLRALATSNASIMGIEVLSKVTSKLREEDRRLPFRYPLNLDESTDVSTLVRRIGNLQRTIGSSTKASGGGNRTRRLRLEVISPSVGASEFSKLAVSATSKLRQRAFVMLWNPNEWPISDYVRELDKVKQGNLGTWSTGRRASGIFPGDLILLIQVGKYGKGLIGIGTASPHSSRDLECVYVSGSWRTKSVDANYVDIRWSDLVHPDDRLVLTDIEADYPQVSWRYLQSSGIRIPTHVGHELRDRFMQHVNESSLESPEVAEAAAAIAHYAGHPKPSITRSSARGQGRATRLTSEQRKALELHSMRMAHEYLTSQGWNSIVDTSSGNPFDFYCRRGQNQLWVEVKGTTSRGASVVLTRGEVAHHRKVYPNNLLVIVASIQLVGDARVSARGGDLYVISPWKINESELCAIGYDYTTGL